jgi:choline dehydrogenase-like flavoprotein
MIHEFKDITQDLRLDADAVVVGSGAGGAVMAYSLARGGKSVILLEEGSYIHPEEFHRDQWSAMKQLYRDQGLRAMTGNLIIPTIQARCVGGSTTINSGISFRLPDDVLEEWIEKDALVDIDMDRLRPRFDEIENFLNISPDPDDVQGNNNLLLKKAGEVAGIKATAMKRNTRDCKGCGLCMSGCPEGAKLSMDLSYVPASVELGAELYTDCRVEDLIVEHGKAVGVAGRFLHPETLKPRNRVQVRAKAIVLACGTMGTPVLLQKNRVANSSGMVGKNLVNHTGTGMIGIFPEPVNAWDGVSQGYCIDVFRKEGFIIEVFWAPPDVIGIRLSGFGLHHKRMMSQLKYMAGWGVMIKGTSTGSVKARSRGFSPVIRYHMNRHDTRLQQKAMKIIADLFFAAGAIEINPGIHGLPLKITDPRDTRLIAEHNIKPTDLAPIGNHPMGTCRMSEHKEHGVVDSHGETHDIKNLFISDASVFPNAPGVNPQVTIMALSAHFAEYILTRI